MEENRLRALFLEVTQRCNAHCDHCGSGCENKEKEELELKYFKKALNEIAQEYQPSSIMLYITGGEPLMRKDLFELTEYATSLGFTWGLVTNGILLNDKNIKKCKDTKMSTISISIDGIPKTHNKFRHVNNAYEIITNNIKKLKEENFVEHIQITYTATKENLYEIPTVYRNVCELGIDSFRISNIDLIGRANEHKNLILDKNDFEFLFRFINKYKNAKIPVCWSCTHYFGNRDNDKDYVNKKVQCYTGKNVASILYNGDIFGCPNIPRHNFLIQGNVKTDNFINIWKNQFKIYRNEETLKSKKCKNCEHWNFCKGDSFHTFNFDKKEQSFCYNDVFNQQEIISNKVNNNFNKNFIKKVTPIKKFTKTIIIEKEAREDIFNYFKWGKMNPLNMYEQQMALVGNDENNMINIKYVIPSILLNRSGNMAYTNDNCLNYILDEVDVLNENLHKLSQKPLKLIGFIHSHPCNTEFRYSQSDIENEKYLNKKINSQISILINPQKELIVSFDSKEFKQQQLILY
jgi:radical SAM protein with 4Fe4S-binding SPASM domain